MLSGSETSQATALVACRPWMLSAAKHDMATTGFNAWTWQMKMASG
jgi:hypothetical protein